jgi:hypothetical protein
LVERKREREIGNSAGMQIQYTHAPYYNQMLSAAAMEKINLSYFYIVVSSIWFKTVSMAFIQLYFFDN